MFWQEILDISTDGRGTYDVTAEVSAAVRRSGITSGLCHIFLQHTSASLILCENADPAVRSDLERFMADLVPDGDTRFRHVAEGPDDMPAHVRSVLTHNDLQVPVRASQLMLGTWQGVFLWEHRSAPHRRHLAITVQGDSS